MTDLVNKAKHIRKTVFAYKGEDKLVEKQFGDICKMMQDLPSQFEELRNKLLYDAMNRLIS